MYSSRNIPFPLFFPLRFSIDKYGKRAIIHCRPFTIYLIYFSLPNRIPTTQEESWKRNFEQK